MTIEYLGFEWDERKNLINIRKHGVGFKFASRAFEDPFMLEIYDDVHSTEVEDRCISIGVVAGVVMLTVSSTDRNGKTKIISARRSTRKEALEYEKHRKSL